MVSGLLASLLLKKKVCLLITIVLSFLEDFRGYYIYSVLLVVVQLPREISFKVSKTGIL